MNKEIAVIHWIDTALERSDTFSEEDLKNVGLIKGVAVGIIIKEDNVSISLAMDWFYETKTYRTISTYPKSSISSIQRKILKAAR